MGYSIRFPAKKPHPEGTLYTNFSSERLQFFLNAIKLFKEKHTNSPIEFSISRYAFYENGEPLPKHKAVVWNVAVPFGSLEKVPEFKVSEWLSLFECCFKVS